MRHTGTQYAVYVAVLYLHKNHVFTAVVAVWMSIWGKRKENVHSTAHEYAVTTHEYQTKPNYIGHMYINEYFWSIAIETYKHTHKYKHERAIRRACKPKSWTLYCGLFSKWEHTTQRTRFFFACIAAIFTISKNSSNSSKQTTLSDSNCGWKTNTKKWWIDGVKQASIKIVFFFRWQCSVKRHIRT